MTKHFNRPLAVLALVALAACSGNGTGVTPPNAPPAPGVPSGTGGLVQQNFVGVGDSLTAGFQSEGLLGDPTVTSPLSAYPGGAVPVTQENGFFGLMWLRYNGMSVAPSTFNVTTALGSAKSPLPLIKGPGLAAQLVLNATNLIASTHSPCDAFNDMAFSPSQWAATRINPAAPIADLGVPGITMHEAVSMTGPITGPPNGPNCGYVTIPGDITSGGLQSLVFGASLMYYPILGQFQQSLGLGHVTELNAALSLHPKLATVWLGGNDMLEFIESHGKAPEVDSPTQFAADETQIISSLQKAGAQVVVADLPDLLGHPSAGEPPIATYIAQTSVAADLQQLGVPAAAAGPVASYLQTTYTQGPGGFLTVSGLFSVAQQLAANPTALPILDPSGPGSGDGTAYIDQTFAAEAIALNDAYNTATDQIATGAGAALVPVTSTFKTMGTSGVTIGPMTLTTRFGGGIFGFDGVHPSNTGYALVANMFIQAADTQYGLTIPPLNPASDIVGIASNDPYNPYLIKAVDPAYPLPFNQ